jgi:uridine kinase
MSEIKIIAITGGSGSGKTTASRLLQTLLGEKNCVIISQDNYYKDQSKNFKGDGSINFDEPNAIDFRLLADQLEKLLNGLQVQAPLYDFVTHSRKSETTLIPQKKYIIVDGTHILYEDYVRKFFNYSLFLDIPENIRFERRLKRDVEERGRTPEGVHLQFYSLVKPMHELYVQPFTKFANYVAKDDNDVKRFMEEISSQIKEI